MYIKTILITICFLFISCNPADTISNYQNESYTEKEVNRIRDEFKEIKSKAVIFDKENTEFKNDFDNKVQESLSLLFFRLRNLYTSDIKLLMNDSSSSDKAIIKLEAEIKKVLLKRLNEVIRIQKKYVDNIQLPLNKMLILDKKVRSSLEGSQNVDEKSIGACFGSDTRSEFDKEIPFLGLDLRKLTAVGKKEYKFIDLFSGKSKLQDKVDFTQLIIKGEMKSIASSTTGDIERRSKFYSAFGNKLSVVDCKMVDDYLALYNDIRDKSDKIRPFFKEIESLVLALKLNKEELIKLFSAS